ncbi:MAG: Na+/H+ antiporter subunit B [Pseudomonadota bacterium]
MNSLILRTAARLLISLTLLFSIYVLLRGHNEPGGGFIGGLIAVSGFAIYAIAFGAAEVNRHLRVSPTVLAGVGLFAAGISGLPSLLMGQPYMTGLWWDVYVGDIQVKLSTVLVFDIGVFLVVLGSIRAILMALEDED